MVWPAPTTVENLQVGEHGGWGGRQVYWKRRRFLGIGPRIHGLVAFCSKFWTLDAVCEMWKEPSIGGPRCLGDPCASGMGWTDQLLLGSYGVEWFSFCQMPITAPDSGRHGKKSRERGLVSTCHPFLCIKPAVTLSWCSHGMVMDMAGGRVCCENERRNGRRICNSQDEWICKTCRVDPWRLWKCGSVNGTFLGDTNLRVEIWSEWYTRATWEFRPVSKMKETVETHCQALSKTDQNLDGCHYPAYRGRRWVGLAGVFVANTILENGGRVVFLTSRFSGKPFERTRHWSNGHATR